ncbi:hypothetical protein FHS57_006031 [Runella defluvii]|uniref:AAA-ATPase-like domain-containing protein n=1 Tax=Runella defluvii TaxID=370973 RepID=A0A7W5ZQW9_9BACT|nr:ATP-binding protein [Runella defluvii]MBB3842002.1 hypothetical protein [Runella defluvii]
MRKYPVGIQDLGEVVTGGYVYVDKTPFAHRLITQGKYYFLSRPRRFGKSLFLSTLYYLFKGRKEIFEGLYIEDKWDWSKTHPIIKISFSNIGHTEAGLYKAIEKTLIETAQTYNILLTSEFNADKFKELIQKLDEKYGKVVVLIDEYDKPIIDYIDNDIHGSALRKAIENRGILKSFYSILKDADPHLKLVFITGVSKFSKVSIFSDLNNLNDITLDSSYSGICGITQRELEDNFEEELKLYDAEKIKHWYNGYSWKGPERVYNPFSLVNFFAKNGDFQNYWFVSGTPTFLMNLAKREQLYDFEQVEIDALQLDAYDIERLSLVPLMFQTGYLTIKQYDNEFGTYELGYPNEEVRKSYLTFLANAYTENPNTSVQVLATQMRNALRIQDFAKVQSIFNTIFKSIPYEIWQRENEHYYHALIHLTFRLLDIYVQSQVQTADGRADAIVILEKSVYAFEFKLDGDAEQALQQIKDKGYLTPYLHSGKTCIGIGLNFSKELKKVEKLVWEEIQ